MIWREFMFKSLSSQTSLPDYLSSASTMVNENINVAANAKASEARTDRFDMNTYMRLNVDGLYSSDSSAMRMGDAS
ncbi:hypothetical protein CVT25_000709 [Psilocybe cyanescens]|uniref:Uncharacterized protein n=1 Tax=Psilocybe cyanescens TaxID=93625 RepID=A0A409XMB7_PSICY|nr:hypothetical protein CVT25_000709 [Psilocybe cyanescens]